MTILEIEMKTDSGFKTAKLSVDGTEYLLMSSGSSVTVLTGKWIKDRRALGRTFWSINEVKNNYKKHGTVLAEYVSKISNIK